jgi:flavin-binding protein dodecin
VLKAGDPLEIMGNVTKVINVVAESEKSWEDATKEALRAANETLRNISSIMVTEFEAAVQGGAITQYRVRAQISFLLDSPETEEGRHLPRTGSGLG